MCAARIGVPWTISGSSVKAHTDRQPASSDAIILPVVTSVITTSSTRIAPVPMTFHAAS